MATANPTRPVPATLGAAMAREPLQVAAEPGRVVNIVIQDQAGHTLPGDGDGTSGPQPYVSGDNTINKKAPTAPRGDVTL